MSLSGKKHKIQRQEKDPQRDIDLQNVPVLVSSDTDEDPNDEKTNETQTQLNTDLQEKKMQIQTEIQHLEGLLVGEKLITVSDDEEEDEDDDDEGSATDQSELDLPPSVESCLQLNLVYQQVLQDTLDQLEILMKRNQKDQEDVLCELSGPIRSTEITKQPSSVNYQHPHKLYLGRYIKPYFKDKLTGLGPPANPEAKERNSMMVGCLDVKKFRVKSWLSWQKNLLIHTVAQENRKRLMQHKLSRVNFLTKKMSMADEASQPPIREQIEELEKDIQQIREKKNEELIGDRDTEHDWEKISNIDFEGIRDPEDIRNFWMNFLHPSINKNVWSKEELQKLKQISEKYNERDWEKIAEELGTGRTAFMCLQVYQRFISKNLKRKNWTPEEDDELRGLVKKMRIGNFIPYTQISYFMEGRDPCQLSNRWTHILDPNLKRGPWTKEEDEMLIRSVARHGEKNWSIIRLDVPGRTDGSCRDRYMDSLKPNVKRGIFTPEEIELLKKLVEKYGVGRWAKIASEIPNRLDSQCMRQWNKLHKVPKAKRKRRKKREDSSEEEDFAIPYMDSDEDEREICEEPSIEVKETNYVIPPINEWIPRDATRDPSPVTFYPAIYPPFSAAEDEEPVCSTLIKNSGYSVFIRPCPIDVPWEERYRSSVMMMLTPDQLHNYLTHKAHEIKIRNRGVSGRGMERSIKYLLRAAVLPWLGHLLIPNISRRKVMDTLREEGEKVGITINSAFLLFLQTMNVDVVGCKETIEQRQKTAIPRIPREVCPSTGLSDEQILEKKRLKEQQKKTKQQQSHILRQFEMAEEKLKELQRPRPSPNLVYLVPHPPVCSPGSPQVIGGPSFQPRAAPLIAHPLLMAPMAQAALGAPLLCHPIVPASSFQTIHQTVPATSDTAHPNSTANKKMHPAGNESGDQGASKEQQKPTETSSFFSMNISQVSLIPQPSPALSNTSQNATSSYFIQTLPTASQSCLPLPFDISSARSLQDHNYSLCGPNFNQPGISSRKRTSEERGDESCPRKVPRTGSDVTSVGHVGTNAMAGGDMVARNGPCKGGDKPAGDSSGKDGVTCTGKSVEMGASDGADPDGPQWEKRLRKRTVKAKTLEEETKRKAETKKKKLSHSSSPVDNICYPMNSFRAIIPTTSPPNPLCGVTLLPGQTMWRMTHNGLVQVAHAPEQGQQVVIGPSQGDVTTLPFAPAPLPRHQTFQQRPLVPVVPPNCLKSPAQQPIRHRNRSIRPQSTLRVDLPYKGVIRVEGEQAPPLRQEKLRFDPSLMFLEPPQEVQHWLSGLGGVALPGTKSALPYLPPFVGSLNMLTMLLRAKKSLTQSSLQLLPREPHSSAQKYPKSQRPYNLMDSTSDLRGKPSTTNNQEDTEEEQIQVIRELVVKHFSSNPAYKLLKARFLSAFTLPAFLATLEPIEARYFSQKEDSETEKEPQNEERQKKKKRGTERKAKKTQQRPESLKPVASDFPGISSLTTDQTEAHPSSNN